jgi:hypothetical protein
VPDLIPRAFLLAQQSAELCMALFGLESMFRTEDICLVNFCRENNETLRMPSLRRARPAPGGNEAARALLKPCAALTGKILIEKQ